MRDSIELHKIMEQRLAQTCRLDFDYLYRENPWGADGRLAAPSPSLWEPWSSGTSTVWWYRLCRCRRRPCHSYDQGRRMKPSLWSGPQWGPEREAGKKRRRGQRESALTDMKGDAGAEVKGWPESNVWVCDHVRCFFLTKSARRKCFCVCVFECFCR